MNCYPYNKKILNMCDYRKATWNNLSLSSAILSPVYISAFQKEQVLNSST
jgi:hypothetical protein